MRRPILLFAAFALVVVGCSPRDVPSSTDGPPSASLDISPSEVERSALTIKDVGEEKWMPQDDPGPSTVQIGGELGPANVKDAQTEATTAFVQKGGSGYLTNSVFLLPTVDQARTYMDGHRAANQREEWTQERKDGGGSSFRLTGAVRDLPTLGHDTYSAVLLVTVTDAEGAKTERKIEYVVYRLDRVISFVVGQDAGSGVYARRQERKLTRLTS